MLVRPVTKQTGPSQAIVNLVPGRRQLPCSRRRARIELGSKGCGLRTDLRNGSHCHADEQSMSKELRAELATRNRNADAKGTTSPQRKGDDIADRLLELATAVVKLLPVLGEQPAAKSLVKQRERCGPAGGANHEEARGAASPADFVHQVRIALKEVRETRYWLKLILRAELLDCPHTLARLIARIRKIGRHPDRFRQDCTKPNRPPHVPLGHSHSAFAFLFLVPSISGQDACSE